MASHEPKPIDIDTERLKAKFDLSHFDLNALLRGVQLTFVGGTPSLSGPPSALQPVNLTRRQQTAPSKTPTSLRTATTSRPRTPWRRES